jgi:hypothetical protein
MNEKDDITSFFGDPISTYSSEMAEAEGILIKTDNKIINFITATVHSRCIEPFIEPLAMTKLSLANKPTSEIIEVGSKEFIVSLKITDADRKKAEKELIDKLLASAILEVQKLHRQDWLYALDDCRGWKDLWVVQNETGSYTLMFSSDY